MSTQDFPFLLDEVECRPETAAETQIRLLHKAASRQPDETAFKRGVVHGVLLSLPFWLILGAVLWMRAC